MREFAPSEPNAQAGITAAIDEAIAAGRVVIYRRRDFEARAMNHRLCLLAGLPLPQSVITGSSAESSAGAAVKHVKVFLPCVKLHLVCSSPPVKFSLAVNKFFVLHFVSAVSYKALVAV